MGEYELICLDDHGRPARRLRFDCLDDATALDLARAVARHHPVEVKHHRRWIGTVQAAEPYRPPDFGEPVSGAEAERDEPARPASLRQRPLPARPA